MPSLIIKLFSETLKEYGGEAAIKIWDDLELLRHGLSRLLLLETGISPLLPMQLEM